MNKVSQEYPNNISGALQELSDLVRFIKNRVFGTPPQPADVTPCVPSANKVDEILNTIKQQSVELQEVKKALENL